MYTSPNIYISCETIPEKVGNKIVYKLPLEEQKRKFKVKEIGYNDKGEINKLIIIDDVKNLQVFKMIPTELKDKDKDSFIRPVASKEIKPVDLHCELCNNEVIDKVAKYSKQNYGKILCYGCQKKQIKQIEI